MKITNNKHDEIIYFFSNLGITPKAHDGYLEFNRDQCHNVYKNQMEWDIIDYIKKILKDIVGCNYYIIFGMKTDEYWTWEVYKR